MESGPLISIGLPLSLFIIMVGIGMTLTARDFHQVTVKPRGLILGTIAQILIMPLAAFALAWALQLPPAMAVGLVIIAACPGGTTSNLFTLLAKGNVALSIVLTVSASLITIMSLPLFANLALNFYFGTQQQIALPLGKTVLMLSAIVLLPVSIGMGIKAQRPALAARAEGVVSIFGGVVLAALIVGIVYGMRDRFVDLLFQAGPATIALNVLGIAIGLLSTRAAGLGNRERLAVATELGIKNGTLGLMVTLTLLHSSDMSVPSAIYGVIMFPLGFLLAAYGRRLAKAHARTATEERASHPAEVG
ncbi:bile acid:sodium symporter family protein [Microbulbifer hydrolyticus]|uniref:BASS family bile acid:Na+ symporter n=1 Tax=Microbulbifer hydrolyticus TaxID=48074 RepID=A0A6P1TA27_9GAMM|nr:bile acid:sodium symporter family protein [Microbulbifer hydrolyticus]MBB5211107.1 BASS family bile acid:Na+ symporter [Microbulbifer hydrolyticus]QHQ38109.1 bile acid:sodium symporter family protein [Microbulbifer hydrolyticus]